MKFSKSLNPAGFLSLFFIIVCCATAQALERQSAVVQEALSGDSVRLAGGKTLKYTGAQAPPLQSRLPLVREYGEQSLAFNKNLVEQKKIWIEWDSQIRDEQNNLLGYVFLEDGTFVNQKIVEAGYARAILKAPNLKYSAKLRRAQIEAKRQKLGLWEKEVNNPYITEYPYIGEKNTKVYYFPDSPELERIPEAQLIKFRSRVEAKAAGYRACATCKEDQDPFKVSDAY